MINEILLRRKNKITWDFLDSKEKNQNYAMTIMKNIEAIGYTFSKDLFEKLSCMNKDMIVCFYKELVPMLKALRGADVKYEPFYPNFPEQVIDASEIELFLNAIVHYWSDGKLLPGYEKEERFPMIEQDNLTVLEIGTEDELDVLLNNLISSKTSLSVQDKEDMESILQIRSISVDQLPDVIPFKENMIVVALILYKNIPMYLLYPVLHEYFKTATDVLRFAVALSNGDTSLSIEPRFKSFKRQTRKLLLHLLDGCGNIEEDMRRHEYAWIRLGEFLHPREYKKYKNANAAFYKLRNGDIQTFYTNVEESIKGGKIKEATDLLVKRPGDFARKLDVLLRKGNDIRPYIIDQFKSVADKVSIPVLLQVKNHFEHRDEIKDRIFFPKGMLTKAYMIPNELEDISRFICDCVSTICENAIVKQLYGREKLGSVYVSDEMKNYCVPQSQRSASSSMKIVTRGSRFKIEKDFIRLFIRWENCMYNRQEVRTDIDLSCTFLDDNYSRINTIAYYDLRNEYSVHSGDYVNAPRPEGACEFIDIDISEAKKHNVRYAVMQVYGYTNTPFCQMDGLYAGWMEREDLKSEEVFEPATVKNRINLTGDQYCAVPIVFDLKNKEVIWSDISCSVMPGFVRNTEANLKGVALSVKGIVESFKPNMYDLIMMNVKALGSLTENRNEADIIFDTDTTKPTQKILVEVRNEKGEVIETKEEERVREDVKIVTPYDIDVFMGELM